jgi:hypothetical protein
MVSEDRFYSKNVTEVTVQIVVASRKKRWLFNNICSVLTYFIVNEI